MRRTHLGVQAAIVLTMVSLVSWPQFRPVRPQSVWRYAPAAVLEAETTDAARFAGDANAAAARRARMGLDQTAFTTTTPAPNAAAGAAEPAYYTPLAVSALGAKLNALLGTARTSLNAPIPYARVVLRNIRTGMVLARATANERGEFSFLDLTANEYIVELLGSDGSVVAASPMVSMARGDVKRAELRAAASAATVSAALGSTTTGTATQATAAAASSGVTRTTTSQQTQESPR